MECTLSIQNMFFGAKLPSYAPRNIQSFAVSTPCDIQRFLIYCWSCQVLDIKRHRWKWFLPSYRVGSWDVLFKGGSFTLKKPLQRALSPAMCPCWAALSMSTVVMLLLCDWTCSTLPLVVWCSWHIIGDFVGDGNDTSALSSFCFVFWADVPSKSSMLP